MKMILGRTFASSVRQQSVCDRGSPQRCVAHSLAVIIITPYDCCAHIIKDRFITHDPEGKLPLLLTGCQSQRAAPLGTPNLSIALFSAVLLALCFFVFFSMQMMCKSCPPEGTCGEGERAEGGWGPCILLPVPPPHPTTGISPMEHNYICAIWAHLYSITG